MKKTKIIAVVIALLTIATVFSGCRNKDEKKIVNIIQNAESVYINETESTTVEAYLGAFEGSQGDFIEFKFTEPQTFNTVFIAEKTATVRQYNIYAEVDGKYKLVHTGKHIFQENITLEETTATALKLEIVNTQIGDDHFIIQGFSAYNIPEGEQNNGN